MCLPIGHRNDESKTRANKISNSVRTKACWRDLKSLIRLGGRAGGRGSGLVLNKPKLLVQTCRSLEEIGGLNKQVIHHYLNLQHSTTSLRLLTQAVPPSSLLSQRFIATVPSALSTRLILKDVFVYLGTSSVQVLTTRMSQVLCDDDPRNFTSVKR